MFDSSYYDIDYFGNPNGKKFKRSNDSEDTFGYRNPEGEWLGCTDIVIAWKTIFKPINLLDVACGRGTFLTYVRDIGIEAIGFDYSKWAVENPYVRCKKEWIILHDATQRFPWTDNSFDLVTVLDFMEHVFEDQIDDIVKEVYRVSKRYAFFVIATIGGGSGVNAERHGNGYIIKKGEDIPIELRDATAAGHVTVCSKEWWDDRLTKIDGVNWHVERDLEARFRLLVPANVLVNWDTVIILDKEKEK